VGLVWAFTVVVYHEGMKISFVFEASHGNGKVGKSESRGRLATSLSLVRGVHGVSVESFPAEREIGRTSWNGESDASSTWALALASGMYEGRKGRRSYKAGVREVGDDVYRSSEAYS